MTIRNSACLQQFNLGNLLAIDFSPSDAVPKRPGGVRTPRRRRMDAPTIGRLGAEHSILTVRQRLCDTQR
ncbi:hypothetical protein H7J06_14960 [Mycobacterium hodleri]|uniref:hypothetical protein n=1 Tax=Mycolicibacterium hodleri TaxID=49897 RepID=UPI0021F2DA5A|nr:hypothetical protein [Mycolicibacterium hodleri]MCV7134289.1 hypothetical protein [Mycolicibacterium hodleri]